MKHIIFSAAIAFLSFGLYMSADRKLKIEQAAHAVTRTELVAALAEGRRWRLVAGENLLAGESQKQLAEACLDRESQAQTDAEARKLVLATAKPRPRTETESKQVVDDETRSRAVSRLNRGL